MLRPFIVKVSVLGYFPLLSLGLTSYIYIYIYILTRLYIPNILRCKDIYYNIYYMVYLIHTTKLIVNPAINSIATGIYLDFTGYLY